MRIYFAQVETRYRAIKECPFSPSVIAKVYGGFMCFESRSDYNIWKIKNESRFSFSYQPRSPIDEATRQSVWQAGNPL